MSLFDEYRDLVVIRPDESLSAKMTINQVIERQEKRGEEVYSIKTPDGFTIFERFYYHNTDGTKTVKERCYLKEGELTPKEAVEAMLKGERLVDFEHFWDIAQYKWDGKRFVQYDSYYIDTWEIINEFNGLKRRSPVPKADEEREAIRVKEILGFDLDLSDLPLVKRQCGLTGAMRQAQSMCEANKWDITETHVYSCLATLESDMEEMFGSPK